MVCVCVSVYACVSECLCVHVSSSKIQLLRVQAQRRQRFGLNDVRVRCSAGKYNESRKLRAVEGVSEESLL